LTALNRDGRVRTVELPFPADPRNTLEKEGREGLAMRDEKERTRVETTIPCALTANRVLDSGEWRQTGQIARRHVGGPVLRGGGLDELVRGRPPRQVIVGLSCHPLQSTGVTLARLSKEEKEKGGRKTHVRIVSRGTGVKGIGQGRTLSLHSLIKRD
jgi:hypothetical protein